MSMGCAITWRFMYLIMAEGHDAVEREHIHAVYNLRTERQEPRPIVRGKVSALDYQVRGDVPEVAFVLNGDEQDLIWTTSYLVHR